MDVYFRLIALCQVGETFQQYMDQKLIMKMMDSLVKRLLSLWGWWNTCSLDWGVLDFAIGMLWNYFRIPEEWIFYYMLDVLAHSHEVQVQMETTRVIYEFEVSATDGGDFDL